MNRILGETESTSFKDDMQAFLDTLLDEIKRYHTKYYERRSKRIARIKPKIKKEKLPNHSNYWKSFTKNKLIKTNPTILVKPPQNIHL